jgi:hypothetical protein
MKRHYIHGGQNEMKFRTLSVVLFCYSPEFRFDNLRPTKIKEARAFAMPVSGTCKLIWFITQEGNNLISSIFSGYQARLTLFDFTEEI